MRFVAILAIVPLLGSAIATPTARVSELFKRDYGCGVLSSDNGVCNFHCLNDVTKRCANGNVLKPYKGECGGFISA
ncbi:hypothetical protein BU26DRAFT_563299 [Trematosphaeria pertusa]|uniref:Uncharacterized protein n=1 Tax=Trematosphaeria pertusa TaxID=390896 RepID=A0A6A6IMN2_9PLEO|nr:uncharacterized protein BU26DRAFT_563299 [Trematosphaeria pertusa]KAF2251358.1 hypothetical protein BU26DRAFT_563299 [Trematosphaeria pertusa]